MKNLKFLSFFCVGVSLLTSFSTNSYADSMKERKVLLDCHSIVEQTDTLGGRSEIVSVKLIQQPKTDPSGVYSETYYLGYQGFSPGGFWGDHSFQEDGYVFTELDREALDHAFITSPEGRIMFHVSRSVRYVAYFFEFSAYLEDNGSSSQGITQAFLIHKNGKSINFSAPMNCIISF